MVVVTQLRSHEKQLTRIKSCVIILSQQMDFGFGADPDDGRQYEEDISVLQDS